MTSASDMVGVGLIGAGSIADYHLDGLKAAGGASLRAIAARTRASAEPLAAKHGAVALDDWRALLDRPDIDAVIVATPDATHAEIARAAAAAGKATMVQKPMAPTSRECREMIAAARRLGTLLSVSFMHRHFEEVARAREIIGEGGFGSVLSARLRNATPGPDWSGWFYRRADNPGGVVHQLGVHGIDLIRHFFGDIDRLTATTALRRRERALKDGTIVRPDVDDHAFATYVAASGALIAHEICYSEVAGTDRFILEIVCERASLHLRGPRGPLAIGTAGAAGGHWTCPSLPMRAPGERHHRAFLDMVRGRAPADDTAESGLATLLIAEAIFRSAARRAEERIARPRDIIDGASA